MFNYKRRFRVGEVPERPKGTDCKSVGDAFGGSNPPLSTRLASGRLSEPFNPLIKFKLNHSNAVSRVHDLLSSDMAGREFDFHGESFDLGETKREFSDWVLFVDEDCLLFKGGSSSVGRASAFQAEGRGFDPRFPLHRDTILLLN